MNGWLEDIYRSHRRGLFGLALSVVREPAGAEDAVHDAFVRMAQQPSPPGGDPASYAYRAVRNAAIDQVRRRRARPEPAGERVSLFAGVSDEDPGWAAEQSEDRTMLMHAIDNLPDAEREAVVMKAFGGLTFKQIAEALGQPLSTIASRHQRALGLIKQSMEKHHAGT